MKVTLVCLLSYSILFLTNSSYTSSYTKDDMEALSRIFLEPVSLIALITLLLLLAIFNRINSKDKEKI
jgi:hypothetical protein